VGKTEEMVDRVCDKHRVCSQEDREMFFSLGGGKEKNEPKEKSSDTDDVEKPFVVDGVTQGSGKEASASSRRFSQLLERCRNSGSKDAKEAANATVDKTRVKNILLANSHGTMLVDT
jgi:hypothetical protein